MTVRPDNAPESMPIAFRAGIEGPAAAGKTTMARTVAAELDATVLEGGMWYRALTYRAQEAGIAPGDTKLLMGLARNLNLTTQPRQNGDPAIFLDEEEVTQKIYEDRVSTAIAPIAQNLQVREVLDEQITATFNVPRAIIVGRHLLRIMPAPTILRLSIDDGEANRRHVQRVGESAQSVSERNAIDQRTAELLGVTADDGVTTVDVTSMNTAEQANLLREFIRARCGV